MVLELLGRLRMPVVATLHTVLKDPTFGLLSPNKGIESMIDALPRIVEKHPDCVYIVLGATHPSVKLFHGEDYRHALSRRARQRGVGEHVIFHNKFVEQPELVEFLGAADVYVTPYLNEAQIVSGTLAYAMGAGKATVSTPYWYAEEMLAGERWRLVPMGSPDALAPQGINENQGAEATRSWLMSLLSLYDNLLESKASRPPSAMLIRTDRPGLAPAVVAPIMTKKHDANKATPDEPAEDSQDSAGQHPPAAGTIRQ